MVPWEEMGLRKKRGSGKKMNLWGEDEAWERMGSNIDVFLGMVVVGEKVHSNKRQFPWGEMRLRKGVAWGEKLACRGGDSK